MDKPLAMLLVGLSLTLGPSCGRKAPLELPPGRAPLGVEGLKAVRRGGAVVLEWTNPGKTVSGRPVGPLGSIEIWVFEQDLPADGRALAQAEIEKKARLVRRIPEKEFPAFQVRPGGEGLGSAFSFIYEPGPSGPKNLAYTVRVFDAKGRASDFAPPVAVADLRMDPSAEGTNPMRPGP